MSKNILIYLHGFNSSPQSIKAQQVAEFVKQHARDIELVMPQLQNSPMAAWQQIAQMADTYQGQTVGVVGSSLGGFFATLLANKLGVKAVLINPAVRPHRLIDLLLGEQYNSYTNEHYIVTTAHEEELSLLDIKSLEQAADFWVLLQQADETLNYRDALAFYHGARITLEPLGDHSFEGFNRYLSALVEFLFEKQTLST
ncbi:MAG: esterase YqiA [Psychrobium sp.]|nr:esterase YqiA [Psychrobium sp.]